MEPKGAGPGQSCRGCPTPHPPIRKIKSQLHLRVLAQDKKALTEGNPGAAASFLISPSWDLAMGQVPNWASWYWGLCQRLGQGRETCPTGGLWGGELASPVANHSPRLPGRLRWGLHWGHCAHPRSGPGPGHT